MIEMSAEQQRIVAKEYRKNNKSKLLKTGIDYWDSATLGIWANDLIIITAKSGAGKTAISSIVAQNVAKQGKNVLFFALEAYQGEIYNRLLYTELSHLVKAEYSDRFLNFKEFCLNKYDSMYLNLLSQAEEQTTKKLSNIKTFYRDSDVKIDEVVKIVEENYSSENKKNMIDLVIIDHLGYFDEEDDYKTIKKAIRKLRTLTLKEGVAIILIAHIKKTDKKTAELVPDMEDISGASEIFKEATQVISMAPHASKSEKNKYATLIKICKNRLEGVVNRYIALMMFDINTNTYDQGYELYKNGKEPIPVLPENMPYWAIKDHEKKIKQEEFKYVNYTDTN